MAAYRFNDNPVFLCVQEVKVIIRPPKVRVSTSVSILNKRLYVDIPLL